MLKGERGRLRRHLLERNQKASHQRCTNFSLELPGSLRIDENEDGLRTEKLRVSDSTMEIEHVSSHKLGMELPNSEDFL
ncbi:hypothetical protein TNCV_1658761 [Trichonephila clavipes]|nr:hypothetical protein TNCV_1658761 [Trichonephila clavipes]